MYTAVLKTSNNGYYNPFKEPLVFMKEKELLALS
jgi:hypothetical protein